MEKKIITINILNREKSFFSESLVFYTENTEKKTRGRVFQDNLVHNLWIIFSYRCVQNGTKEIKNFVYMYEKISTR